MTPAQWCSSQRGSLPSPVRTPVRGIAEAEKASHLNHPLDSAGNRVRQHSAPIALSSCIAAGQGSASASMLGLNLDRTSLMAPSPPPRESPRPKILTSSSSPRIVGPCDELARVLVSNQCRSAVNKFARLWPIRARRGDRERDGDSTNSTPSGDQIKKFNVARPYL